MLAGRRGCHGHDGGASSSSPIGKPPPAQEGSPWVYLVSVFLVCTWIRLLLMRLLLLLLTSLNSKSDLRVVGVVPRQPRSPGGWLRIQ
jgi:hypothetical protein